MTGAYDDVPLSQADPDDPLATWDDVARREENYEHEQRVTERVAALRIEREARARLAAESAAPTLTLPSLTRLDRFLSQPDEDAAFRIECLMPTGGNVVLAAQYKAGKSTLVGNLLRSFADGDDFLGRWTTAPVTRVVLIDNELDPRTLRRWLSAHGIVRQECIEVLSLRGSLSTFDILDPATRAAWAEKIGGADIIILDCLRPVLDALGLDENHDAGRFLVAFDSLRAEAGIAESVIVHHMGHNGERSRGDSRILDWPDATWRIVRESDDPASPRYFSAMGRDVDVHEGRLGYDSATRALTYGEGSRREAKTDAAVDDLAPKVLAHVTANPGCSGADIERSVAGKAVHVRKAREDLVTKGAIVAAKRTGSGGGNAYFPTTSSTSSQPRPDEPTTSSTSSIGRGTRLGRSSGEPRPAETGVYDDNDELCCCVHGVTLGSRCSHCGGRAAA
ncbi:AAA family ATPase [Microbacterium sp. NPDC058389]|uniref:AAA family ATPase n=1 Tax=Microbacterium sp. NPDC058389 TaxID=3346475 RepID=UPI003652B48D